MTSRIAVVGGGITGLAAAYELRAQAPDAEVVVLEATDRLGSMAREADRTAVFEGNARKVYPKLAARLKRQGR